MVRYSSENQGLCMCCCLPWQWDCFCEVYTGVSNYNEIFISLFRLQPSAKYIYISKLGRSPKYRICQCRLSLILDDYPSMLHSSVPSERRRPPCVSWKCLSGLCHLCVAHLSRWHLLDMSLYGLYGKSASWAIAPPLSVNSRQTIMSGLLVRTS